MTMHGRCRAARAYGVRMAAAVMLAMAWTAASAQLDGRTMRAQAYDPDLSTPDGPSVDGVVGPGVEVTNLDDEVSIDYSNASILITDIAGGVWPTGSFVGIVMFDVNGTMPPISGVSLDPSSTQPGASAARISFDAQTVRFDFKGLNGVIGNTVRLNLQFGAAPSPTAVPTLGDMALVSLPCLLMLLGAGRIKRRAKT